MGIGSESRLNRQEFLAELPENNDKVHPLRLVAGGFGGIMDCTYLFPSDDIGMGIAT